MYSRIKGDEDFASRCACYTSQQTISMGSKLAAKTLMRLIRPGSLYFQVNSLWPRNEGGKAETSPYLCLPSKSFALSEGMPLAGAVKLASKLL